MLRQALCGLHIAVLLVIDLLLYMIVVRTKQKYTTEPQWKKAATYTSKGLTGFSDLFYHWPHIVARASIV